MFVFFCVCVCRCFLLNGTSEIFHGLGTLVYKCAVWILWTATTFVTNNVIIKYIFPTKVFVYLNHSTWNNYSPRKRAVLCSKCVLFVSLCLSVNVFMTEERNGREAGLYFCVCDLHGACVWAQNMFLFEMSTFKRKQLIIQWNWKFSLVMYV